MANTKIKIEMDEKKVSPLKYFIAKEHTSIEVELQKKLDELYLKHVPAEMREYIEHDIDGGESQEQSSRTIRAARTRSPRVNSNARRTQSNVTEAVPSSEPCEDTNAQSMTM